MYWRFAVVNGRLAEIYWRAIPRELSRGDAHKTRIGGGRFLFQNKRLAPLREYRAPWGADRRSGRFYLKGRQFILASLAARHSWRPTSKEKCIFTHGYVNREWVVGYVTTKEQKVIATDTKKFKLSYRDGRYKDLISGKVVRTCPKPKWRAR